MTSLIYKLQETKQENNE